MKTLLCILTAGSLLCGCASPKPHQAVQTPPDQVDKFLADMQSKQDTEAADFKKQSAAADERRLQERQKWEQARKDYLSQTNLNPSIRTAIEQHGFIVGMTATEAKLSHREPDKINQFGDASGTSEQWIYGDTYLYFTGGILKSYQKW